MSVERASRTACGSARTPCTRYSEELRHVNGVLGAMNPVTPSMEVSSAAVPRQVTTGFAQLMA
jgi:hypothetical protein